MRSKISKGLEVLPAKGHLHLTLFRYFAAAACCGGCLTGGLIEAAKG